MAKGRMMNKRISKSDKLAALDKDRHRVVYFMLYPHLDREGRYSADPRDIKEDCLPRLRYSVGQIQESLIALHAVGLITLYDVGGRAFLEASRFDDFQVGLHKEREAPSDIPQNPGQTPERSGVLRSDAEKVPLNLKVKVKFKVKDNVGLISQIIEHLNHQSGKKFSPTSAATIRHINARISEGRTVDDFKRVIDIKVATWKDDPKMDAYLRPETLFGTKMEGYLNESIITPRDRQSQEAAKADAELQRKMKTHFDKLSLEYQPKIDEAEKRGDQKRVEDLKTEANAKMKEFSVSLMRSMEA
jgi:uncharacterized phage protein (TIGR02220 family)